MITQARLAATLALQRPEHPRAQPRDVCPHCKRPFTIYDFATKDGQVIETYHCAEHGDVVPIRSAIVNEV